ncbi:hypothetical protein B0H66DRAFT_565626 [Apodospora peruviana]|uniref:Uncharacterized protein n=1 Tax=Apodospora peruviana TaxID=516989 RepID=A0AAE0I0Z9_9PEZI|nr:hypothetical protein B0H66DRAFT_565626 [Apodospora peruviana]
MPALQASLLQPFLGIGGHAPPLASAIENATTTDLVCAWPLSSQYGPGSRIFYYLIVAVVVCVRKHDWLRNAALAAALMLPATAALHAITLASVHTSGAVDLDVYGALQLLSMGILTAPLTAGALKLISTGRDVIILWTSLVLAGEWIFLLRPRSLELQPY